MSARIISCLWLQVAANFTVGMFGAMFIFLWRLPGIISSYQPGWVRPVALACNFGNTLARAP